MRWMLFDALALSLAAAGACAESGPEPLPPEVIEQVVAVQVQGPSAPLALNDTVRLVGRAVDADGNAVAGARITWTSLTPALAEINSAGLLRAIAPGDASIRASVAEVAATVSVEIEPDAPPPPPSVPAPEPSATATIRWQDDFSYTTASQIAGPYATRGSFGVAPGRSGNGVIFRYSAGDTDNLIERNITPTEDFYIRYWYKTSAGADPTCGGRGGSGFKWFMAHRDGGARYTMGVSILDNGGPGSPMSGVEFTSHDNGSQRQPNPFLQNVSKAKRFSNTNDGQWHKYTLHIRTGSGGYEQIWIDDVLVLDNRSYGYDHAGGGIGMINFPGNVVSWYSGCDFTVTVDDLVIWTP